MKKYLAIFKMSLKENFTYVPSLFFKFISFFINMFAITSVWRFVYDDPSKIINGYTFQKMIWYLLIAEVFGYAASASVVGEIQEDVSSGTIAYKVNKPYQYIFYNYARNLSDSLIKFIMYGIIATIIATMFVGPLDIELNVINIICILIAAFLAITINSLIKILITLSALWFEDSEPFHWIYKKFLLLFGIFFPVEMFPKFLQPIIKASPIFVTLYGPTKLILDFSYSLFINVIGFQLMYLLIVIGLLFIVYGRGVKKLNVNGG